LQHCLQFSINYKFALEKSPELGDFFCFGTAFELPLTLN
jgi:hypothetical protein